MGRWNTGELALLLLEGATVADVVVGVVFPSVALEICISS